MAEDGGGGGGFTGLFKEHPWAMMGAVIAVALIAYLSSRGGGSGSSTTVLAQPAADPNASNNAAAITEAGIAAGAANVSTAANLIGSEASTAANLRGSLAQSEVSRQVGLAQIDASLAAEENQAEAQIQIASSNNATELAAAQATAAATSAANQAASSAPTSTPVINGTGSVPTAIQLFGSGLQSQGPSRTGANPVPPPVSGQTVIQKLFGGTGQTTPVTLGSIWNGLVNSFKAADSTPVGQVWNKVVGAEVKASTGGVA